MQSLRWFYGAIIITLPWLVLSLTGQAHHLLLEHPASTSILAGLSIIGAAFLLSWATELAERDIPRSLALIVLALISVLPEYAVDLHFAWEAGKNPEYKALAVANMTGANRILIGVGWALVAIVYYFKHKKKHIDVDESQGLELSVLLLASLYALVIPLKGTLSLMDMVVFFAMFAYYAIRAMKGEHHDGELDGIAGWFDARLSDSARRLGVLIMLGFGGYVIWLAAEPFAEGLVATGTKYNVSKFLLVQWLAPLASESPEGIVALLFALKGKGSTGIGALISSKVNQWTLLVGAIPLVYAISYGAWVPMELDHHQREELLLTAAQSLFAAVIISDFKFALWEALMLLGLFVAQFFFQDEWIRYIFSALYLVTALIMLMASPLRRQMVWRALTLRG